VAVRAGPSGAGRWEAGSPTPCPARSIPACVVSDDGQKGVGNLHNTLETDRMSADLEVTKPSGRPTVEGVPNAIQGVGGARTGVVVTNKYLEALWG